MKNLHAIDAGTAACDAVAVRAGGVAYLTERQRVLRRALAAALVTAVDLDGDVGDHFLRAIELLTAALVDTSAEEKDVPRAPATVTLTMPRATAEEFAAACDRAAAALGACQAHGNVLGARLTLRDVARVLRGGDDTSGTISGGS